jgi:hypothetical protein
MQTDFLDSPVELALGIRLKRFSEQMLLARLHKHHTVS